MDASPKPSSLHCELRIIRAKNVDFISTGNLFVRYYLSAVNNERIRLNSREISLTTANEPYWNESVSLECLGTESSLKELEQQLVVFELRWRKTTPVLGRIGGSKLLGRAEVQWKQVLESSELAIEKWVIMVSPSRRALEDLKPPALQIGMKVRASDASDLSKRRDLKTKKWNECGCRHGSCNGGGDDFFALAAALEAL